MAWVALAAYFILLNSSMPVKAADPTPTPKPTPDPALIIKSLPNQCGKHNLIATQYDPKTHQLFWFCFDGTIYSVKV